MRIMVDALPLLGRAGGRSYLYYLFKSLLEVDRLNEYKFLFRNFTGRARERPFSGPNISELNLRVPNRILEYLWTWNSVYLPGTEKLLGSPDLFFSTIYFSPVFRKLPVVSVIYDITTMRYAPYIDERKMFDLRMRNTIHRSKALIAISEYTRRDVIEYYNAPPEKIFTVPLAADSAFGPSRDEDGIKTALKKYGIPLKYILYTGNLGPHKNLKTLVEAYYLLKKRRAIEHKLVLCGNKRWGGEVVEKINALNLENDVLLLDYVPDADLPHLYHGAEVFVYISLYEGFGLPVLEAMQSGAPVVASNVTSIPEVAGNACLLVDPLDMEGVAGAIIKLIEDGKLRERLAALGLARAAMFGWDKTAKETLRIFETAAG